MESQRKVKEKHKPLHFFTLSAKTTSYAGINL